SPSPPISSPSLVPRHPTTTLFPYTTLFRSHDLSRCGSTTGSSVRSEFGIGVGILRALFKLRGARVAKDLAHLVDQFARVQHFNRSEEHTSELQSRFDLVCRLLLEKKKTYHI